MVETITPAVHGGRNFSYYRSVALHVLGAMFSAALFGLALGGLGALLGGPWEAGAWAVVIAAVLYAARELLGLPVPLPDLDRQVPEWWRTYFSPPIASFLYGLGLGVGYLTFLSFGTLVAVTVGAVVSADPLTGAALMAPFGAARGLGVLVSRRHAPERVLDRLDDPDLRRDARLVNGAGLLVVALAAVAGLL
jgi:cytochrome c biogenesis protein CcdA